ncbi:hypothetical protein EYF80_061891 [Liparis tanakae]|uniref:Uncharacterized protein n=1 Tax=Liparis tanakae TaxID=230148 RepID=A0A4Z2EHC4_9TELE|nr:hypothetical protein EYF80_061891 [Liparis tanakae]
MKPAGLSGSQEQQEEEPRTGDGSVPTGPGLAAVPGLQRAAWPFVVLRGPGLVWSGLVMFKGAPPPPVM